MEQVNSSTSHGFVSVMVTDGDTHSPRQWAEMTVGRIMSLDEEMNAHRARLAHELRGCILGILGDVFTKVRDEAKRVENINVETIADSLTYKLTRAANGTPWQLHFSHPETNKMIWLEIMRSLNTIILTERKHLIGKGH